MALSAMLRRWTCGGANWKSTSSVDRKFFKSDEASLSSRWSCGLRPRDFSRLYVVLKALMWSVADRDCIGSAAI